MALDREAVVARRGKAGRQAAEQGQAVVLDLAGLAVHQRLRLDDAAPERGADRLVPQADPEDGDLARKVPDHGDRDPRLLRRAWAGRDHDGIGGQAFRLLGGDGVVAEDADLLAQRAQELHQVVGKAVEVVDHEDHELPPPLGARAIVRAVSSARALLRVSWYSRSGSESATMPAPTWTVIQPSLMSAVRIVMQESKLPP